MDRSSLLQHSDYINCTLHTLIKTISGVVGYVTRKGPFMIFQLSAQGLGNENESS